ncbi:MAG: YjbQ family protein [Deltaproteobacteria bacterium]|nr:YjbQ family protein [Deltaproteobacteria bacterium]
MIQKLQIRTRGPGLTEITENVSQILDAAGLSEGLCTLLVQHTSASLTIQENADPSAKRDLERWLERLVPEGDPLYTHTLEGADDMPSHIKAALTATTLSIPFQDGRLCLGTWQGVYLWEHRRSGSTREVVVHLG